MRTSVVGVDFLEGGTAFEIGVVVVPKVYFGLVEGGSDVGLAETGRLLAQLEDFREETWLISRV